MNLGDAIGTVLGVLVTCSPAVGCKDKQDPRVSMAQRWPGESPGTPPDLIMVGDSITESWDLPSALRARGQRVVNHGKGGQTHSDLLHYFDVDVLLFRPKSVFIGGGINDLRYGKSVDDIVQSRLKLMRRAREHGIKKIYFGTVTPFNRANPMCGYGTNFDNVSEDEIAQLNAIFKRICGTGACTLVDMHHALTWQTAPTDQSLWSDCVHPNTAGNARMTAAFEAVYSIY